MAVMDIALSRRRTVRAPINEMDKSTVISIFPKEINEVKHTIQPGRFHLDAGSYEKPSILVVGSSSWWREIDEEQPLLEIPNGSVQVAESIVKDYCNGLLACTMNDAQPGIFWVMGAFTVEEVKSKHKALLDKALERQKKWFLNLVKMADVMWTNTNGNPLCISEDMRLAARLLSMDVGKDWMKDFTMVSKTLCPACGSPRDNNYPVCPTCKAVDMSHPKAKELKFAQ